MKTAFIKEKFAGLYKFIRTSAGLLVLSNLLINVINFIFNAYLGRHLDLDDFGIITTVGTFVYILNFFVNSMSNTVNQAVSYLEGKSKGQGSVFFRRTWIHIFVPSILSSIAWVFAVPIIGSFLHVSNYLIIACFAPAILFGSLNSYNTAYLQGMWRFGQLSFLGLFEAVSKLILAIIFVKLDLTDFVAVAIPLSIFMACLTSTISTLWVYIKSPILEIKAELGTKFSFRFYIASLMRGISTVMFLSLDVILAKHYLSAHDAGVYSLLSIVGKMIYFFGTLLNTFVITLVSRLEGEGKNPKKEFLKLFIGTSLLSIGAGLGVATLGWYLVPLLLGKEALVIVPHLPLYALAMTLFTLSTTIVLYELARKSYFFPAISFIMSLGMLAAIKLEHSNVHEFVEAITKTNIAYFVVVAFSYFFYDHFVFIYRNVKDILTVYKKLPESTQPAPGKMNILFFNWRDTKSIFAGGAETYVQSLAKRWVRDGHSVTLFTSNDEHLPPNGETDGVRIIRRGGFYTTYAIASIYYMWHFRGKFDVIVDSENGIPFFTPLYAKEKVYCLVHHIHQEVFRKQLIWPLAKLAMFLEKDLMPWVYKNSSFITVSNSSKCEMERLHITNNSIEVVHPGIDTSFLTPGEKALTPTISYVGRLKEHKSVHILIKAFKEVLVQVPDCKLIIAGDGEEENKLKQLVRKLKIVDSVEFHGKVSEEEKREILRSSWVFVTPSMIEGWGITTIEANACGTPVIASDVSGLRDSVKNGETGILVTYGDVPTLANKITLLLQDNKLRDTLSQNAISWASNFAWDKSAEKFIKITSNTAEKVPAYKLKKPNIVQIILSSFVFPNIKITNPYTPERINEYKLESVFEKKDNRPKRFGIGLYKKDDKKFFIKTWSGKNKNIDYLFLINECLASIKLYDLLIKSEYKDLFKIPKIIDILKTKNSMSVVFEYIEADIIENLSIEKQAEIISKTQHILTKISKEITQEDKRFFMKRNLGFYVFTTPVLNIILCLTKPEDAFKIIKSFFHSLPSLKNLLSNGLILAHRDLKPHNVMYKNGVIYLIDCESMVLTLPQYDRLYLSIEPDFLELSRFIEKNNILSLNLFLKNYMIIHFALDFRDLPLEQAYYLSLLN